MDFSEGNNLKRKIIVAKQLAAAANDFNDEGTFGPDQWDAPKYDGQATCDVAIYGPAYYRYGAKAEKLIEEIDAVKPDAIVVTMLDPNKPMAHIGRTLLYNLGIATSTIEIVDRSILVRMLVEDDKLVLKEFDVKDEKVNWNDAILSSWPIAIGEKVAVFEERPEQGPVKKFGIPVGNLAHYAYVQPITARG